MRKSYLIAIAIALAAIGWVAWGEATREPVAAPPDAATRLAREASGSAVAATSVRVDSFVATPYTRFIEVTGKTEAKRTVEVMTELDARVVAVPVAKGDRVKRGQTIARLAIDDRNAWLAESQAALKQREIEFNAAQKLAQKGYRSDTQFAAASAALDQARAQVRRMEVEVAKTTIVAPFDGVLEARPAEIGGFLKTGQRIATLVDEDPFLLTAQVTEQEIGRLSIGATASGRLATGETVQGVVSFIAKTSDSATRTFRVEVEVPNPEHRLRAGVTASLRFPVETVPTHLLSPAILTLAETGVVGVRGIDARNRVVFHPVDVLAEEPGGVRVAGLPERVTLIVVGQEFVRAGEPVEPVRAEPGAAS